MPLIGCENVEGQKWACVPKDVLGQNQIWRNHNLENEVKVACADTTIIKDSNKEFFVGESDPSVMSCFSYYFKNKKIRLP